MKFLDFFYFCPPGSRSGLRTRIRIRIQEFHEYTVAHGCSPVGFFLFWTSDTVRTIGILSDPGANLIIWFEPGTGTFRIRNTYLNHSVHHNNPVWMKRDKARGPAQCSLKILLFWYQGRHSFISNLGSDIRGRRPSLLPLSLSGITYNVNSLECSVVDPEGSSPDPDPAFQLAPDPNLDPEPTF